MNDDQIKQMVQRFLMWKLPINFSPDNGISFQSSFPEEPMKTRYWPIGTNLLSAYQAENMIRYILEGVEDQSDENPKQDVEESVCKGDWVLDNNCKTCPSCISELPGYIKHLKDELEDYKRDISDSLKTMLETHIATDRIYKSYIRSNLERFIIQNPPVEQVYVTIKSERYLMSLSELTRLINGGSPITNIVAVCRENDNDKVVEK